MILKTEKHQHYFEVNLHWQGGRQGVISANDVKDLIKVATPPEFEGGVANMWSPEHLYLCSLSSSLMTAYLGIAAKKNLEIVHFECNAIGQIQLVNGHLEFTVINLYPKIFVNTKADITLANEVLLKSYKQSIVANSVTPHLIHHGEVLLNKSDKNNVMA